MLVVSSCAIWKLVLEEELFARDVGPVEEIEDETCEIDSVFICISLKRKWFVDIPVSRRVSTASRPLTALGSDRLAGWFRVMLFVLCRVIFC
jgi:hypothetical protein